MLNRSNLFNFVIAVLFTSTLICAAVYSTANAAWPEKPVRIIVSFPPGGASDLVARLLGKHLTDELGQQFVVENKPGAAGTVAATALKKANGDGYTFMLSNLTPFNVAPTRFPNTPYDPIKDFTHVTYIGTVHLGLLVKPELGVKDLTSFIKLMKAKAGDYDYGTSGVGSWGHIISAQFKSLTSTDIVHIPYKGSGPMRLDFRSGTIPVIFDAVPQNMPVIQDGTAILLAVTANERQKNLPNVPTFTENGYSIVAENWLGFSAPSGLDPAIAKQIDAALQKVMNLEAVKKQFAVWGLVRTPKSSEEFSAYVAEKFEEWKPLVKAAMKK
ncbi:MAG: tripartite tricarboxylate transporter substrate binding protein [SAR324 cluster bacterium]|nr:tripartite tricarboxylate transporter substrate binding protein [SAR324 cluster bacterium]